MKTNSFARGILKIRVIALCLASVGLAVVEVGIGESVAARYGQYTATQNQAPQAPNLSIGDLMAAASVVPARDLTNDLGRLIISSIAAGVYVLVCVALWYARPKRVDSAVVEPVAPASGD